MDLHMLWQWMTNFHVSETNYFKKGTDAQWSAWDEVNTVELLKVWRGISIAQSDGQEHKQAKLLKIPNDTIKITHALEINPNVFKAATWQH